LVGRKNKVSAPEIRAGRTIREAISAHQEASLTLTTQEFIELIEAILKLIRQHRLKPPAAVRNLSVAVNRSKNMSTATLNWTLPTTRTDGSALAPSDIGGINVFDSAAPDPSVPIASILGVNTFTTGTLTVGTHAFTIVVIDTTGHMSTPSNAASGTVEATLASPSPVNDLTVTIN
jgi:hypothetical protein